MIMHSSGLFFCPFKTVKIAFSSIPVDFFNMILFVHLYGNR